MLKIIFSLLFSFFVSYSLAYASDANPTIVIDQKILDLPITLISGKTVTLRHFKGNKPVYLKFWASYCQPCFEQMPHLAQIHQKYGDKVQVIAVNIGLNEDAKSVAIIQKKFGLKMPIAIDKSGQLAKAFNLIATPYHVLLDKNANVVYAEFEAPKGLDEAIKLVAEGHTFPPLNVSSKAVSAINLNSLADKPTALFFVATWCDWYLKEQRPAMSKSCVDGQHQVNTLAAQYPNINWVGVVTRLWTEDKDVAEYRKKFDVQHSLTIDNTNAVFLAYNVKDIPTLILLDKGKEIFRTQHISASATSAQVKNFSQKISH